MRPGLMLAWLAGLALAALASWWIWREVPLADETLRFAAALAPVVVWALVPVLFSRWMFRAADRTEAPQLRDQRRTALRFLADRGLKGSAARHSLPLFLVAGPAGVGKSALLEQSQTGLGMPLTIGASRWWVGSDAIFVETNFDSGASAQDVFDLIRSVRPRRPVNATLLVISPPDLALADEAEMQAIAGAITGELRLLEERIGVGPPVYLLLAKCDMMPGFREFFDRLEPQDRDAPWGFSLPFVEPMPAEAVIAESDRGLERMLGAMRARHIEWLSREADAVRSSRIHGFATQGAALSRQIRPILEALVPSQTHVWHGAVLRGVFLTSARQEPLTIDPLLPELSQRFALPRIGTLPPDLGMEDENHGYFIAGALRRAILPEAGLVAARRSPWPLVQWALIALIAAGTLAAGWTLFRMHDEEVRLAARMSNLAAAFEAPQSPSTVDNLASVIATYRRFDALAAEIGAPAHIDLPAGATGRQRYASAIRDARRDYGVNVLLPHLSALLETQLADVDGRDDAELTALIGVSEAAGDADSQALRQWLEGNVRLVAEEDRERFVEEGIASIREGGGLDIDPAYAEAARRMLAYRESLS